MQERNLHDTWVAAGPICGAPDGEYSKPPSYLEYYEEEFRPLRNAPLTIVEIGIFRGQFLETLGRYFKDASILGIDIQPERATVQCDNVLIVRGDQGDKESLDSIFAKYTPRGADIIIDDASHIGELTQRTYDVGIKWLKPGGSYYIEDWGTGYWGDWPDGSVMQAPRFEGKSPSGFASHLVSHNAGMIGLVKSLVDHVGAPEVLNVQPIASMSLRPGVVKLIKTS
jgi:SAM-dependent methyltransferase